jgi:hypothetical protein
MLDRKEINALNYRTKVVYVSSRREITGVNSLHHCACTPKVSKVTSVWGVFGDVPACSHLHQLVMRGLPSVRIRPCWTRVYRTMRPRGIVDGVRCRKPSAWESTDRFLQRHNECQCGVCMDFARTSIVTLTKDLPL